jgi:hypothetical protein
MDKRTGIITAIDVAVSVDIEAMQALFVLHKDDEEVEVSFPLHYEVCPACDGHGKYVNPHIDAHGITAEEFDRDWSYQDRSNYLSGMYDVTCTKCSGNRVIPELNTYRMSELQKWALPRIKEDVREEQYYRKECLRELGY